MTLENSSNFGSQNPISWEERAREHTGKIEEYIENCAFRALKPPAKKTEKICQVCNNKRRNGGVKCVISGCNKHINSKKWQFCKHHAETRGTI